MNKSAAIKLVHVARRELGIDDDAWRALLRQNFQVDSSKALDIAGLYRLVEHLKKCGFKVRHPGRTPGKGRGAARSRPLAGAAQALPGEHAKIRALWLFMHKELSLVKDPSEKALAAYVRRLTGVEALQWLDGKQSLRIIETLKKWAERVFPDVLASVYERVRRDRLAAGTSLSPALVERVSLALELRTYDRCFAAWEALGETGPHAHFVRCPPWGPRHPPGGQAAGEVLAP
jgi:phage gp16-like protein